MSLHTYAIGDRLVLKAGLTRTAISDRTCRLVGLLPAADRGEQQYRVRFGNENFERRIAASDIDQPETSALEVQAKPAAAGPAEPWLKPGHLRVGK